MARLIPLQLPGVAIGSSKIMWSNRPYTWVYMASEDLLADDKRRESSGQHADFGIGRRFLRMSMGLMKTSQVYLPAGLRKADATKQTRADYYLGVWPKIREKWLKYGALEAAFAKERPLGLWRQIVQEVYDIKLKL